ncbi:MAG: murein biosynthesis integral membrane protein MurJ, partial [Actinobacteria bacterium]|nr:murein biosynthesis integral membrane protein MurJ [Actinomycetota bacterium]
PGRRRRLARSTAVFSVATGASRILGLVREILVRRLFGVEGQINAFTVAFQVPNLVRALVADAALSAAFVPVFSELLEKRDTARAWRIASTLLWLVLLGLGALTALFILLAPWIMRPFGYEGADEELVVNLSRILFPTVVLLGLSGIVVGILNSYEHFAVPALAPVAWNLVIILGLLLGVPGADGATNELYVYAGSIVVATFVQLLLPIPWLRGRDDRLRVAVNWRDPAVRRVFVHMIPVTLGLGLINFNQVVNTLFAARYIDPNLAPSAIEAAFRIYMLPQGVFAVAVATVLFPLLSRLAAREDTDAFRSTTSLGLRQIAFFLLPASAVVAALAIPIVRLLYERGAFGPAETEVVGKALAAFAVGLTFNGTMLMLNRAFFSLQSPWVPTAVALANLTLQVALNAALYRVGVWGIPLATSIVNVAGTAALLVVFRRRLGRIEGGRILASYVRIALASALAAAAAFGAWYGLDDGLGRAVAAQIASVGAAVLAGAASFLLGARILRIEELDALISLVRRSRSS